MTKTQLTIRGFDDELEQRLRHLAKEHDMSLNRAALTLMRKGAGLDSPGQRPDVVGTSLDHLMGIWSDEEAAEFDEATRDFDRIDEDLWV